MSTAPERRSGSRRLVNRAQPTRHCRLSTPQEPVSTLRPCRCHAAGVQSSSSRWSLWSEDSLLSIGSKGSVLSIGSVGSFASIGSVGSALSIFSVGSWLSAGSVLSSLSRWSVLSHLSRRAVLASGHSVLGNQPPPAGVLSRRLPQRQPVEPDVQR